MPDSKNRRDLELAKYEAMSTEELQAILREDASKPEGEESNEDVLFCVMEVLARRRQARNEGKTPEEALESFVKNYMPEDEEAPGTERESTVRRFMPNARRWMSGLVAAAAMIVLVFGMSLTANAFGFDLWDVIVKWTRETIHFGYSAATEAGNPDSENYNQFSGLQDALDNYDIQLELVPTYFPEGFSEVEVKVEDTPRQRRFVAKYEDGEIVVRIRIVDYLDSDPTQIERSDSLMEVYTSAGTDFYLFNNEGQLQAVWIKENFECYISGPISLSELKAMIDSIEEG